VDLDREITLGGHPGEDGKRYGGNVQCNLRYRFRPEQSGDRCRVAEVITDAEVVLTLPRWTNLDAADEVLRRRWERFIAALRAHEDGHRRLCVEAIAEVRRELLVLTRPTCEELQAASGRTYTAIEARFSRMSSDYDVATRHGETQGASPRTLYP
jgi:predicted secreted Zn-dependent protease